MVECVEAMQHCFDSEDLKDVVLQLCGVEAIHLTKKLR